MGAGDQGMMFGFACKDTATLMPAPIDLAHSLMRRHAQLRASGEFGWLRPDGKAQVTVRYEDYRPGPVCDVVLSTQHAPEVWPADLPRGRCPPDFKEAIVEQLIKPVLGPQWLGGPINYLVNPAGRFVEGGPQADCGLTGRKIIVDTYGGMARHGGGAFSGKDPSKVDRSAAYAARARGQEYRCRRLGRALRASGLLRDRQARAGGGRRGEFRYRRGQRRRLRARVRAHFDLSVEGIIRALDLEERDLPANCGVRSFRGATIVVSVGKRLIGRRTYGRCPGPRCQGGVI